MNTSLMFFRFLHLTLITTLCLFLFTGSAIANTIYVNASAPPGGNGNSWKTAVNDLQLALNMANDPGGLPDQIRVAAGSYKPGLNRTDTFNIPNNTDLLGGFFGETILSGDLLGNDVVTPPGQTLDISSRLDNAYHVVTASNVTFTMRGFTISGGYNESDGLLPFVPPAEDPVTGEVAGAGLIAINGNTSNIIALRQMIFKDNYVNGAIDNNGNLLPGNGNGRSGGAYIFNPNPLTTALTLTIEDSEFINNHAARFNAALGVRNTLATVTKSIFDHNVVDQKRTTGSSGNGGANFDASVPGIVNEVSHSVFTNNISSGGGAALGGSTNDFTLKVSHSKFIDNHSTGDISGPLKGNSRGGAIFSGFGPESSDLIISHCLFQGNSATLGGGAITVNGTTTPDGKTHGSLTIDHSEFIENYVEGASVPTIASGGAISSFSIPAIKIEHSLFKNNIVPLDGGAIILLGANVSSNPNIPSVTNDVIIENNKFVDNKAGQYGGAIAAIRRNTSEFYMKNVFINNNDFSNNIASRNGGAIYDSGAINQSLSNNHFVANLAGFQLINGAPSPALPGGSGGAIAFADIGARPIPSAASPDEIIRNALISNNKFDNNIATINGGAISLVNSTGNIAFDREKLILNIDGAHFMNNSAMALGGAIYQSNGNMNVVGSHFKFNTDPNGDQIVIDLPATTNGQSVAQLIIDAIIGANPAFNATEISVIP